MSSATCFLLEETDRVRLTLRRYQGNSTCPRGPSSYHEARVPIGETVSPRGEDGRRRVTSDLEPTPWHDDPRWPPACACGYQFQESDPWQLFTDSIWVDTRTGKDVTLEEAEPGAMWNAWWRLPQCQGPDGRALYTRLPNGHDWCIDGLASNCKLRSRPAGVYCWQREGTPPVLTVKRGACPNCGVGGGSIQDDDWHGFLTNGVLAP